MNLICFRIIKDNGDRAFRIEVRGSVKEVLLSAVAVKGLITLNTQRRTDRKVDKTFLKALVIGVCSLNRFKESTDLMPFKNGEIEFIEGTSRTDLFVV